PGRSSGAAARRHHHPARAGRRAGPRPQGRVRRAVRARAAGAAVIALLAALAVQVGSKQFTESVILDEVAVQALQAEGVAAQHRRELGGTRILWDALRAGQIDSYPEYTGTIAEELLPGEKDMAA